MLMFRLDTRPERGEAFAAAFFRADAVGDDHPSHNDVGKRGQDDRHDRAADEKRDRQVAFLCF